MTFQLYKATILVIFLTLGIAPKCQCDETRTYTSTSSTSCQMEVDGTCTTPTTNPTDLPSPSSSSSSSSKSPLKTKHTYKFPGCRLFLAPSTIQSPNAGLGIFTTRSLKRGQPITFPDIIIHINDYLTKVTSNNKDKQQQQQQQQSQHTEHLIGPLINQYSWNAQSFGGQFEGHTNIASVLPGIGSLSNAQTSFAKANTIPYRPDVDEANVPRTKKAGAGSFTHYHNLTFYASRDMKSGDEIFVYYDVKNDDGNWWKQRVNTTAYNQITVINNDDKNQRKRNKHQRDDTWLIQNGLCVDNIKVEQSKIKGAGRGAFATRFIPKGSIVAPLPLVVIPHRDAFMIRNANARKKKINDQQLILNYCLGHENSTLLFFPTTPGVNLINHAPSNIDVEVMEGGTDGQKGKKGKIPPTANIKLQWSTTSLTDKIKTLSTQMSMEELKNNLHSSTLMMEYVATRDIQPREEILLDYGPKWIQAWTNHEKSWKAPANSKAYSPSYVMEDVAGLLRTEKEQRDHPYPSNLDISCFYQYSVYHAKKNSGIVSSNTVSSNEATTVKWQMDRKTFEFKNLRPCDVMSREKMADGHWVYTVKMKNRPGLPKEEVIPKGELHVVSNIPRGAIRFTDKIYSTDQHLPNAFRHEIGIPDEIFPEHWMDLRVD